jgi:hypothetical protein
MSALRSAQMLLSENSLYVEPKFPVIDVSEPPVFVAPASDMWTVSHTSSTSSTLSSRPSPAAPSQSLTCQSRENPAAKGDRHPPLHIFVLYEPKRPPGPPAALALKASGGAGYRALSVSMRSESPDPQRALNPSHACTFAVMLTRACNEDRRLVRHKQPRRALTRPRGLV